MASHANTYIVPITWTLYPTGLTCVNDEVSVGGDPPQGGRATGLLLLLPEAVMVHLVFPGQ